MKFKIIKLEVVMVQWVNYLLEGKVCANEPERRTDYS